MLIDFIDRVVPIRIRQSFGFWTANQAGRYKWLLNLYFLVLCGKKPENLQLLVNGDCLIGCKGHWICSPRDGIYPAIEVLQSEVYEQVWHPQSGDVVFDVGAYVGAFSVKAAEAVGNRGLVVAIEPEPANLRYLRQNVALFSNIRIVAKAASNKVGMAKLYLSSATACHSLFYRHKKSVIVETVKLDTIATQLGIKQVGFIKIDCEGMELEVLKGARRILANNNVRLAIGAYHTLADNKPELPGIIEFLQSKKYKTIIKKGYVYAEKAETNTEAI